MTKELINTLNNLRNNSYYHEIGNEIGNEYVTMINDFNGSLVIETGKYMLEYLFDIFELDIKTGMETFSILMKGYPEISHSDIFTPYYDSLSTRRLWFQASKKLDNKKYIFSSLIMNTYFRWYTSTYELFRKMLIFNCYCLSVKNGSSINLKKYLFGTDDPAKRLKCEGPKERLRLLDCYNSVIRHSISHGNLAIIPSYGIIIRQTNEEKTEYLQNKYQDPDDFIKEVTSDIEIMYNAIRLFMFITISFLFNKHKQLFLKHIDNYFYDEVIIAMVKSIQADNFNIIY